MGNHFNRGRIMKTTKETLTEFALRKKLEAQKEVNNLLRDADGIMNPSEINEILLKVYAKEEEAKHWGEVA
jgi:hypothetical protein